MIDLIFDTETTGKYGFKKAHTDPSQPHIVQLGALLFDADKLIGSVDMLLRCPVDVPAEAANIHGFDTATKDRGGVKPATAVFVFEQMVKVCDRYVAHNMDFDFGIMCAESWRAGRPLDVLRSKPRICTMQSSTNVLKLPGKYGYKWPSLDEAFKHFVDPKGFEGAHNAMADVWACYRVFRALEKGGHHLTVAK